MIWIIVAAAIVLLGLVVILRRRRSADGVASFQRQIDALSPEARRPVVDRMQRLDDPEPPGPEPAPGSSPGRGLRDPGLNPTADDSPDDEDDASGS
ncbi:hypothetical protein BH24ACT5_BH24ACT5_29190 [soil metagenome]